MVVRPTLRRVAAVVAGSTLALSAGPLAGMSVAAPPFVANSQSPAAGAVVKSPATVSACFSEAVALTSTITVVGTAPVPGTTSLGSCPGGTSNKVVFTPTGSLAEGAYEVTVVAGEAMLPVDATTVEWSFTVDTTPPATPGTLTITNPVGPANVTNVTVGGTTSPNTAVTVSIANHPTAGATATGSGVSNGSGAFSVAGIDATALADGVIRATVTATDTAGNAASATVASVKDGTAPARVSTTPANGGTSQTTSTVVVVFNEALNTATSTLVVKNGAGNALGGSAAFSNSDKTMTFTATSPFSPAGGTYSVNANAVDVAGNAAPSVSTFSIDETDPAAPTVLLTNPVNDANKAAATVSGVAEPGSTVAVSVDDSVPGSPVTGSGPANATTGAYSISVDLTSLVDGDVVASATATDPAGNTGPAGVSGASTKDTVAPAAPSVSMTDPVTDANKTTVTVNGIAAPGSAISISVDDTTAAAAVTATASTEPVMGFYTAELDLTSLADGVVTATVTATDAAGNVSAAGTDSSTKDTGVPAKPSLTVPTVNDANKAAVPASGTAEPGSTVSIAVTDGVNTVNASPAAHATTGAYSASLDLSGLADGPLTATAKTTDTAGNPSAVETVQVVKDTGVPNAPVVTMPAYVNNAGKGAVELSGTAEPSSTLSFTVNDTDGATPAVTSSVVTAPNGTWTKTLDLTALSDGTLTASVTATDGAGNVSAAGQDTAVKDVVKPAAPSVLLTDPLHQGNAASAVASGSAEDGSTVNVSVDDTDAATAAVTGNDVSDGAYSVTLDLSSLSDGTLTATATATDAAGNVSTAGTDTAAKDTTALDVVSSSPAHNSTVKPPATVSMTMNEPLSTSQSTISLTDSTNAALAGATSFINGNRTIVFTPADTLSDSGSPYTVHVSGRDTDGSDSLAAGAVFTVDGTSPGTPTVSIPDVNAANDDAVGVTGVAEPGSSVLVSVDDATAGSPVTGTVTADGVTGAYTATLDLSGLADGVLTATAVATDGVGNSSGSGSDTASKDATPPATPTVSIPEFVNDAGKGSVTVSGVAEAGSSVLVTVTDGVSPVSDTVTAHATTGAYDKTFDLTTLADGALTATAVATDAAGNPSGQGSDTSTKDTGTPGAPAVELSDPVNAANKTTATVSGVAEKGSTVAISLDDAAAGDPLTSTKTADAETGAYSATFDVTSLADGTLTATVTATDAAGNTSPAGTDTATKDASIPDVPTLDTPAVVTHQTYTAAPFSGTAEPGSTVTITVDDSDAGTPAVSGSTVADGAGAWNKSLDLSTLADGTLTVVANATDAAGNGSGNATGSVLKDVTRAFTVAVTGTPVSGTAYAVTVTAHQTYATSSPTDATYTGTPVLSSADGHTTPGTCTAAVAGVASCTGTTFGDLGAQTLSAAEGTGDDAVSGTKAVTVQPTGLVFSVAPEEYAEVGEDIAFTVVPTAGVTGAATAGYDATRTLVTTGGASTPATGTVLTCPAAECGGTVSFSSRGPKTIKVTDNGTPSLSTPAAAVTIPYGTSLSLVRSALQVNSGQYVTISGKLLNTTTLKGLGGRTVEIYRKTAPNTTYKLYTTVTTKADGTWAKRMQIVRNTSYGAYFDGDDTHYPSISVARTVKAAQVNTATWSTSGRTVKAVGSVRPNQAGRTVYLQYKKADGSWAYAGAKATVTSTGRYTLSRTFAAGRYVLRTAIAATSVNAAGYSSTLTVRLP